MNQVTKKPRNLRQFIWVMALVLPIVLGLLLLNYQRKKSWELTSAHLGQLVEAVYGVGTVKAKYKYDVKLGVISIVKQVYVQEGQKVSKGQLLIDFKEGSSFRSPLEGTVTLVSFLNDETVFPQVPVLRVENLNELFLEVALDQRAALRVKRGQKAKISFESLRGHTYQGSVQSIFPREGTFLVHISTEQLPPQVLPGMSADVSIEVAKIDKAMLIPRTAITNGKVTVVRQGKRVKVPLDIGASDEKWAQVLGGDLKLEDEILLPQVSEKE